MRPTRIRENHMPYRAKITSIIPWIDSNFNLNKYNRVKDLRDVYIEVNDIDMADDIESLNKLCQNEIKLKNKILDTLEEIELWK